MPAMYRGHKLKTPHTILAESDDWVLARRDDASRPPWVSVKMWLSTGRLEKANYWLGWHTTQHRFAGTKDAKVLASHPELMDWVREVLASSEARPVMGLTDPHSVG